MPITLDKLFSATVSSSFEYMGETVEMTWAPARYTGEMADLAEKLDADIEATQAEIDEAVAEEDGRKAMRLRIRAQQLDRKTVRRFLSALLVSWDVLDGKKPFPTDEASLAKLDPSFLAAAFTSLGEENRPDPTRPDHSNGTSAPKASPAPSRRGSRSSGGLTTSGSPRGK
ncbi:MAG TPA: hypothetical protein VIM25_06290 [Candidatus Limnocylindrales bacterium]